MAKHRLLVKNAENDHIIKARDDLNTFSVGLNGHPTVCHLECDNLKPPVIGTKSFQILMIFDSFSSQTWAIFVPNRNFDLKSIESPTKSPLVRC